MQFGLTRARPARQRGDCIVVGVYEGGTLSPSAKELDLAAGGALGDVVARGDMQGVLGTTLLLHDVAGLASTRILLVGLGDENRLSESRYREALCAAARVLATIDAGTVTLCLHQLPIKGRDNAWKLEQAVLALTEALYVFDALKSKPPKAGRTLEKVLFHLESPSRTVACEAAIERGEAIAEGVTLARDLGNLPGNICTPSYLAGRARKLGRQHGFTVRILDRRDIKRLGMGGLLAVARGSREPPVLIVMEYGGGARKALPIVLVGKGITFDSGGVCIKPAPELDEMKFDMCGAASVFGALHAAALMKLPINVVGIVPAAENMPGGNAIKPGDIVTTLSGQTVEVLDTDSEGRVVLCDALTYAEKYTPAAVIDVATLTGAIVTALGDVASGLFSNNDALAREITEAGSRAWDRAWHMPLWDEYQDTLRSNFADFPNIGARDPDAITGACFLSRFTRAYPWAHLDIAGTASKSGEDKGATGRPVALLAHFLEARART